MNDQKTKRFWISWYEPMDGDDFRPRKWPLANGILAYWCSGQTFDGETATLCAVIEAVSIEAARAAVKAQGWSPAKWRFIESKPSDWMPPPDRFPPCFSPKCRGESVLG